MTFQFVNDEFASYSFHRWHSPTEKVALLSELLPGLAPSLARFLLPPAEQALDPKGLEFMLPDPWTIPDLCLLCSGSGLIVPKSHIATAGQLTRVHDSRQPFCVQAL
jgi:hypothetical protein